MYIFNRLAGISEPQIRKNKILAVTLPRSRYSRPSTYEVLLASKSPNSVGFLVARNPYEHLISTYRDEIVGTYRNSIHDKLCKQMVVQYRHILPQNYHHKVTVPTFKQFVNYISDEYRAANELDMHRMPAYRFCNLCQVNLAHIQSSLKCLIETPKRY